MKREETCNDKAKANQSWGEYKHLSKQSPGFSPEITPLSAGSTPIT